MRFQSPVSEESEVLSPSCIEIVQVVILCSALAAAHASLLAAPLVSTGISAESRQDRWSNRFHERQAEVGKAVAVAAPAIAAPLAYAAPAIAAPAIAAPAIATPLAYGGIVGRAGVLGLGYGVGLGHGGVLGLGYGAGILGAGIGKVLI
ncbi:hypothetical protein AVEN_100580-1 [Araneus ventricosus]|uniref:Uncharacterized protein n=1 Tax=Araneus ventricosus TaxID=182803 RepID=A0A4Y2FF40_ARAVE|nr:hypothetical protein AVEN_100580-1 [Araneus ventricosus]